MTVASLRQRQEHTLQEDAGPKRVSTDLDCNIALLTTHSMLDLDEPESELPTGAEALEEDCATCKETVSQPRASQVALRRAAKAKDWELSRAQERIEGLERAASEMQQKLLVMERAKQREASLRGETQRQLSSLEDDTARVCRQRDEFRKRLLAAKQALQDAQVALEDAREEVLSAECRREETRTHGEQRAAALEAELIDNKRLVAALRHQLQEVLHRQLRNVSSMPRRAGSGGACRTPWCRPMLASVKEEDAAFHSCEEAQEEQEADEESDAERKQTP